MYNTAVYVISNYYLATIPLTGAKMTLGSKLTQDHAVTGIVNLKVDTSQKWVLFNIVSGQLTSDAL